MLSPIARTRRADFDSPGMILAPGGMSRGQQPRAADSRLRYAASVNTCFIAVYHDEGTGEFSRGCLIAALETAFAGRAQVRRIRAAEICASDSWHATTHVLAFPGGADRPYAARLNGAGNASITRYVRAGGTYFGVCAGAYYACARIAFEVGRPGEVCADRELGLFAGSARGSLHALAEPYSLDHLRCTAIAPLAVSTSREGACALYWGGPEFVPDAAAVFTPLLEYTLPNGASALAAVKTTVGAGRAILAGVHAEVRGAQFPVEVSRFGDESFAHGMRVSAELERRELGRRRAFEVLIGALE
jgi:glutamine amidotransferase-like uncharacterized protein